MYALNIGKAAKNCSKVFIVKNVLTYVFFLVIPSNSDLFDSVV